VTALLCLPAVATLRLFRDSDSVSAEDHPALLTARELRERQQHPWHNFGQPVLHIFYVCAVLFSVSNAAMLPLALNGLAKRTGETGFVVSTAIIVPQVVVALCSPWVGRLAQVIGRKPILLVGFAVLPVRGLLFATLPDAIPLVALQTLDGVSGTVFGLMVPLIAADVTRRTGFLNLAISSIGLASAGRHVQYDGGRMVGRHGRSTGRVSWPCVDRACRACSGLDPDARNQARQAGHRGAGRSHRLRLPSCGQGALWA
jgi:hypothetical protein